MGGALSEEFPEILFHAGHASTTTCRGNDLLEKTTRQGLCKVEASLRSNVETERLLTSYPTDAVAVSSVLGYFRANRPDLRYSSWPGGLRGSNTSPTSAAGLSRLVLAQCETVSEKRAEIGSLAVASTLCIFATALRRGSATRLTQLLHFSEQWMER